MKLDLGGVFPQGEEMKLGLRGSISRGGGGVEIRLTGKYFQREEVKLGLQRDISRGGS